MARRLFFLISDLEREIRDIAPQVGEIELNLDNGAFGAVARELANHRNEQIVEEPAEIRIGCVVVKRSRP